jgi:hypothetical protein
MGGIRNTVTKINGSFLAEQGGNGQRHFRRSYQN